MEGIDTKSEHAFHQQHSESRLAGISQLLNIIREGLKDAILLTSAPKICGTERIEFGVRDGQIGASTIAKPAEI